MASVLKCRHWTSIQGIRCLGVCILVFFATTLIVKQSESVKSVKQLSSVIDIDELLMSITKREELGKICETLGFEIGVELGVQRGYFAHSILENWTTCKRYLLVDLWGQQKNYVDTANLSDKDQDTILHEARTHLMKFSNVTMFLRNFTTMASLEVPNSSVDFIYVDARHDYCGVMEDIKTWWPKLKVGGVMAGHDYLTASEQKKLNGGDDWSICGDGVTINQGAVKGAVDEFAKHNGLGVYTTQDGYWKSWVLSPKPHDSYFGLKSRPSHSFVVPNIIHFIWLSEVADDIPLLTFISILSAIEHIRPEKVYFYCYKVPRGSLWDVLRRQVNIKTVLTSPKVKIYNRSPYQLAHKSDITRMSALLKLGGIYIDADVIVLRSLDPLRYYEFTLGVEGDSLLCNAVIISSPSSMFLRRWISRYKDVDFNCWNCHSVQLPSRLSLYHPEEINIVNRETFYAHHWSSGENVTARFNLSSKSANSVLDDVIARVTSGSESAESILAVHLWSHVTPSLQESVSVSSLCDGDLTVHHLIRLALRNSKWLKMTCAKVDST